MYAPTLVKSLQCTIISSVSKVSFVPTRVLFLLADNYSGKLFSVAITEFLPNLTFICSQIEFPSTTVFTHFALPGDLLVLNTSLVSLKCFLTLEPLPWQINRRDPDVSSCFSQPIRLWKCSGKMYSLTVQNVSFIQICRSLGETTPPSLQPWTQTNRNATLQLILALALVLFLQSLWDDT